MSAVKVIIFRIFSRKISISILEFLTSSSFGIFLMNQAKWFAKQRLRAYIKEIEQHSPNIQGITQS